MGESDRLRLTESLEVEASTSYIDVPFAVHPGKAPSKGVLDVALRVRGKWLWIGTCRCSHRHKTTDAALACARRALRCLEHGRPLPESWAR